MQMYRSAFLLHVDACAFLIILLYDSLNNDGCSFEARARRPFDCPRPVQLPGVRWLFQMAQFFFMRHLQTFQTVWLEAAGGPSFSFFSDMGHPACRNGPCAAQGVHHDGHRHPLAAPWHRCRHGHQMPTATPTSGMVHLVAGAQLLSLEWPGMPWGHGVYCRTLLPTWERHGVALGIISSQPFLYPFLCSSLIPLALFS